MSEYSVGTYPCWHPTKSDSDSSAAVVSEIQRCATHFQANKCADGPLPGLAYDCGAWDTCMKRDPTRIGRARVGAELLAEVANGFMETISWKTLVRSTIWLCVGKVLTEIYPIRLSVWFPSPLCLSSGPACCHFTAQDLILPTPHRIPRLRCRCIPCRSHNSVQWPGVKGALRLRTTSSQRDDGS